MDKRIREIADYYGSENQARKCIEECGELIQALCKGDQDNIQEEMADVQIMIWQLEYLTKCQVNVNQVIEKKINRQIKRIRDEQT